MANQKQYVNSLCGFLIILGLIFASFTPIANAIENNFITVDKDTNLKVYEWSHRPVVILSLIHI